MARLRVLIYLGGEDVARAPPDVSAESLKSLNQHGGLDGHVEGPGDAARLAVLNEVVRGELLAARHEARHLQILSNDGGGVGLDTNK